MKSIELDRPVRILSRTNWLGKKLAGFVYKISHVRRLFGLPHICVRIPDRIWLGRATFVWARTKDVEVIE